MSSDSDWRATLEETQTVTAPIVETLVDLHGDRAKRAITAVTESRIKQYKDFIVVVGHQDEYIIEQQSCTCDDTKYNLDADNPTDICWHVIATEIAIRTDALDEYDIWYTDVWDGYQN